MGVWVDHLGGVFLEVTLSATLLLSLVSLAMLGCRQPARRIVLARASILCVLLVLPMAALIPRPRIRLVSILERTSLASHPLWHNPSVTGHDAGRSSDSLLPTFASPSTDMDRVFGRYASHARVAIAGYLVTVSLALAWLLFGYWGVGWLRRKSWEASPGSLDIYRTLPSFGHRARPSLRVANRLRRPVLLGLFRQTILIPVSLDAPGAEQSLRLTLLHELAHSDRRDPWFSLASGLAHCFWFILPPMWWIRAQMRLDQEFLADHEASSGFGQPRAYAASLLNMAAPSVRPRVSNEAVSVSTAGGPVPSSALFQRVLMLVRCPFPIETHPPRWWGLTLITLILFGSLGLSSITVLGSREEPVPRNVGPMPPTSGKTFYLSKLTVSPTKAQPGHKGELFEFPFQLPPQFLLDLDVWGHSESLRQTRLVGIKLSLPSHHPASGHPFAAWHHIRIRKVDAKLTLWIDGHPVPADPKDRTTFWLSVESPLNWTASFENLILHW
ncbi:M56 family metallopeptidase [Singulisphaera rosea]